MFLRFFGRWLLIIGLIGPGSLLPAQGGPSLNRSGQDSHDLVLVERALARARAGETVIPFGDIGIAAWQLKAFRARLIAAEKGERTDQIDADTPPGTAFKWPGGIIPYRFDPTQVANGTITAAKMQQFRDGVAEWMAFANVQFNEFTGTTPPNFVTVQENASLAGGYSSSVGMGGGEQFVQFGPMAWNRGTVCHETGHALGYWHEQQRDDRDTYVIIDWSNIDPGNQPNFAKLPGGTTAIAAYDFYSVMHYSRNALAINPNLDTITMQPAYVQYQDIIGQVYYRTLSKLDRAGMAVVYGNPGVAPSALVTNTKDSGAGSLRAALYYAFDKATDIPPVPTTVAFQIPTSDPGFANNVFTIMPTYLLVAPGAGTTIDGATQTAFTGNTNTKGPEVVLNGSQLPAQNIYAQGLLILDSNCVINSLVINGFNLQGILLDSSGATGNTITGCYLGTDPTGTTAVPNAFPGIEIAEGANGNTIGGTTAAARNVISGNNFLGISIHDSGSNNNVVSGNYIGLNATGKAAIPNTYQGVEIFSEAQGNIIGGTVTGARNVISGNNLDGVALLDSGTTGNLIEGNYIGLTAAGTAKLANAGAGVAIVNGAASNTVGSATIAGGRNVISGNLYQGVVLTDAGTTLNNVVGNIIGMNPAGNASLGNGGGGVDIFGAASSNNVGGTANVASNFISGNTGAGINISGTGTKSNKVLHNFIGTNLSVTAAIPNNAGVQIFNGAQKNTIGGTNASSRNIISGNNFQGITISGTGTKSNTVAGNYIGLNKTGTAAIPNTAAGISIFLGAQSNTIGGTTASSRNVISGNLNQGTTISDSGTNSNKLLNNYIGTNAAGTVAIANSFSGIEIFGGAASNVIGAVNQGNVISGNAYYGVAISGTGTSSQSLQGNVIGVNAAITAGIPNGFSGLIFFGGAQNNLIGNSTTGAGNVIAFNTFSGIDVFDSTTTGNDFNANSIYSNGTLGVNLVGGSENGFGVTANDPGDADTGPNQLQNYPVLTSANSGAVIVGTLNSVANKSYRVDFYSSPTADASGFGEGQTWIGATTLTTDGSGNASFNVDLPVTLTTGSKVTATATNTGTGGAGSSEFSAAITVVP
jgi:Astacin (Peptidase family M12A)